MEKKIYGLSMQEVEEKKEKRRRRARTGKHYKKARNRSSGKMC